MSSEAEITGALSFEGELENLERAVNLLERGDLPLEEAIQRYESGYQSLKKCHEILEKARKRIEILTGDLSLPDTCPGEEPGGPGEEPGDPDTEPGGAGSDVTWRLVESSDQKPEGSNASIGG